MMGDVIKDSDYFEFQIDKLQQSGCLISKQNELFISKIRLFYKNNNLDTISKYIFHSDSKKCKYYLINGLLNNNNLDFYLTNIVYCATANDFNIDHLFSFIDEYLKIKKTKHQYLFIEQSVTKTMFKILKKYYNDKRIFDLLLTFNEMDTAEIIDSIKMVGLLEKKVMAHFNNIYGRKLKDSELQKEMQFFLPKKPKCLLDFHESLDFSLRKLNEKDFPLNQREDILILDKKELIKDESYIIVPNTHYDLIDLGNKLKFCIGNGTYSNGVKNGQYSIVAIYDQKTREPICGVQFTRYKVSQAKGFGNSEISLPIKNALEELLIKKPELPGDFIPFKNHSFLYGYKYDNNDLFIMFKHGAIYKYEKVAQNVYEMFLIEKGKVLNSKIKPNYNCVRVF